MSWGIIQNKDINVNRRARQSCYKRLYIPRLRKFLAKQGGTEVAEMQFVFLVAGKGGDLWESLGV